MQEVDPHRFWRLTIDNCIKRLSSGCGPHEVYFIKSTSAIIDAVRCLIDDLSVGTRVGCTSNESLVETAFLSGAVWVVI